MMVSLQMQHLLTLNAALPTATLVTTTKLDMTTVTVDRFGQVAIAGQQVAFPELERLLKTKLAGNANYPVYIQGHRDTTHGAIIYVLDFIRRAGIHKVALSVKTVS